MPETTALVQVYNDYNLTAGPISIPFDVIRFLRRLLMLKITYLSNLLTVYGTCGKSLDFCMDAFHECFVPQFSNQDIFH